MSAHLVNRDGDRATVRLTPSWLGRVFGARETTVDVLRRSATYTSAGVEWVTEATRRPVGRLILRALDAVEVQPLPRAMAASPRRAT